MITDTMQPAVNTAETLVRLAGQVRRDIDSHRRGMAINPRIAAEALLASAKQVLKDLPRAA